MINSVIKANTDKDGGNPHSFIIQGEDEKIYFCHLGDIKHNEDKLYGKHDEETLFLDVGDEVKFQVFDQEEYPEKYLFAIHIEKR